MKKLALLVLLIFTPAFAPTPIPTFTVSGIWPGGQVGFFMDFWSALEKSGVHVKIDGVCISACTFFLAYFPEDRICVTPRASLGFHQASSPDGPEPRFSKALYTMLYPAWVRQWIEAKGGLEDDVHYMFAKDMAGHLALCSGEYDPIDPEKIIAPAAQPMGTTTFTKPNGG